MCVVDLRLVKEVRPGKTSPDFEKWSEEARRHDTSCCLVLLYGREFRLKTLSLAGLITLFFSYIDVWSSFLERVVVFYCTIVEGHWTMSFSMM